MKPPDFSCLRYAQCWEDADLVLEALAIRPGERCLSIVSGGENTLSLLTADPAEVLAVDVSDAQLACLELKMAAFRSLEHEELIEFAGCRPSVRRQELYRRCRRELPPTRREFWDARSRDLRAGLLARGKFEKYLGFVRRWVLPLAVGKALPRRLLEGGERGQLAGWYATEWNTWRWRLAMRLFCSRALLGRFGRDPRFFDHVEGDAWSRLASRIGADFAKTDPAANPYLGWILRGEYAARLPHAYRRENFERIRARLDRIRLRRGRVEEFLDELPAGALDGFNLSNIFEYMSPADHERCLEKLTRAGRAGARMVYWNMLAARRAPPMLADRVLPRKELEKILFARNKVFFYQALVIEEVAA